jgi:DNA-binding HxlR family transcriptional regulator
MTTRTYGQFCGFARALELVGERWALLIVRDLLVGPKRFTDLRQGLLPIPTNILAKRLKELEEGGIVQRRVLPRPQSSVVYELTERGAELEEAMVSLGRWGAKTLDEPRPGEIVTPSSLVMAFRTTFRPQAARGVTASYELRLGPIRIHLRLAAGRLEAGAGPLPGAELVIETGPGIRAVMAGEVSAQDALASGLVRLTGREELFATFVAAFRI